MSLDLSDPVLLAALSESYELEPSQAKHRIDVLKNFAISNGDKILELGCGQGECTTILAAQFPESRIDAVDPAPLDYGSPETLGEAQERIKGYELGKRIIFHRADPVEFLERVKNADGIYDVAVLCHCLWYFRSEIEILEVFRAAKSKVRRLCIAEWSLDAERADDQPGGKGTAFPHVLAALTCATCEAHIENSDRNIRTLVSPDATKELASQAGWVVGSEETLTPSKELEDARWEVDMLFASSKVDGVNLFLQRARRMIEDKKIHTLLESMMASVKRSVDAVGGEEHVECMTVWTATFS
ncbi:S-adenosyl-L-methionine-dependent methyltransferase [Massariosphaeria phaeospora]|uniref:S-adenosyl-L-methionine-dependent methyltransferase n=1 Tax=Massariosphaeria phaeospora TaxID=100035 RepID=A0A7C8IPR4_9PLEO|nr:S-adenosyl-L-methionine-dependent methyltransferase [Massariosphaeria phaeospora]